jgi:hypothetical protein
MVIFADFSAYQPWLDLLRQETQYVVDSTQICKFIQFSNGDTHLLQQTADLGLYFKRHLLCLQLDQIIIQIIALTSIDHLWFELHLFYRFHRRCSFHLDEVRGTSEEIRFDCCSYSLRLIGRFLSKDGSKTFEEDSNLREVAVPVFCSRSVSDCLE